MVTVGVRTQISVNFGFCAHCAIVFIDPSLIVVFDDDDHNEINNLNQIYTKRSMRPVDHIDARVFFSGFCGFQNVSIPDCIAFLSLKVVSFHFVFHRSVEIVAMLWPDTLRQTIELEHRHRACASQRSSHQ